MPNTPNIRFEGFSGDWERRKLGELAYFSKGNGYSKSDLQETGTPIILYGRLYTKYEFSIDSVDTFAEEKYGSIYSEGNEVIVPASGETAEDIARASAVVNAGIMLGGDLNIIKPNELINAEFLALNLSNGEPKRDLVKRAQGKSVVHIHNSDIQEVNIYYPILQEQNKIVAFIMNIDSLITLHQHKSDEMKQLKKYMLQKMFPKNDEKRPQIRFKGFTGDWEQRKLGDVFDHLQNNSLSRADLSEENGKVLNLHYGDILIKFGEVIDLIKEKLPSVINEDIVSKYLTSILKDGDIVIADAAEDETVGKCSEIKGAENYTVISGLHTIPLRPKKRYATGYLGYFMNSRSYHDQLLPLMQGTKVLSISKAIIKDTLIAFPKLIEEQTKIGVYFQSLDQLITHHQRKCDAFKELKKYMLQNMFIGER